MQIATVWIAPVRMIILVDVRIMIVYTLMKRVSENFPRLIKLGFILTFVDKNRFCIMPYQCLGMQICPIIDIGWQLVLTRDRLCCFI